MNTFEIMNSKHFETKLISYCRKKVSVASFFVGVICLSSCFHYTDGFFISPSRATANTLRPMPSGATFQPTFTETKSKCNRQISRIFMMPIGNDLVPFTNSMTMSSFHISVVEVFDGSSIIDPVVVSSSFWSGLQKQILSAILGQFIASVVFGILVSFLAPQISALRDAVLTKFTNTNTANNNSETSTKTFIKADSISRPAPDFGKLLICLFIDVVGVSSEALPIVGEFTDILTAPVAALALQNLFPGSSKFIFLFEFAEEILPLTDFIPFATICWVVDTYFAESSVAGVFQLGSYNGSTVTPAEKAESFDIPSERSQNFDDKIKR